MIKHPNFYLKMLYIILLNQHTNLKLLEKFIKYNGVKNIVKKYLETKNYILF